MEALLPLVKITKIKLVTAQEKTTVHSDSEISQIPKESPSLSVVALSRSDLQKTVWEEEASTTICMPSAGAGMSTASPIAEIEIEDVTVEVHQDEEDIVVASAKEEVDDEDSDGDRQREIHMEVVNKTQVKVFVFSGLTDNGKLAPFLFILFLHIYMVTILANIGMMTIIYISATLHTPMYFFLSYLSLVDIFYSSVFTPRLMHDLIFESKTILFSGCALQFYFCGALACSEGLLLSNMAYDRYAAICHPLHYVSIMTKNKCLSLVFLVTALGFLQSSVQTTCVFSLKFCRSNLLNHFYCHTPSLLRLSCSDTFACDMISFFIIGSSCTGCLMIILLSYILIIISILQIKSAEGLQKAFSTCSSHLTCICIFYGAVMFTYLRSASTDFDKLDKMAAVFYTVVTPMLNPLIYSLRNQEVKRIIMQSMHNLTVINTEDINYERTNMELCCKQKRVKQFKIWFIFLKVSPFALMTALHTLGILSISFMSPGNSVPPQHQQISSSSGTTTPNITPMSSPPRRFTRACQHDSDYTVVGTNVNYNTNNPFHGRYELKYAKND
ncbi:olfactory receptor 5B12-like [Pseudophryne corroboree]|uniref:olfactory receptor 5B12-like n=1 Tax=Pseudophryne corroboree TaxID=495146 RepID=UPI0030817710